MRTMMLVSKEKQLFKEIDATKVSLGQFQTREALWLTPQVEAFIKAKHPSVIYDPFAGHGSLLATARERFGLDTRGLDIDPTLGWPCNDSLSSIPPIPNAVIVTNPPYLAKHSAKRKRVHDSVAQHFTQRSDLYQLALDRCKEACPFIVAIVPETIINSSYPKYHFESITILEGNPFDDTDCPVCVVCIDSSVCAFDRSPQVFLGSMSIGRVCDLEAKRLRPHHSVEIDLNVPSGRIALRAVDLPNPLKPIKFMHRAQLDYPADRIKVSSRLVTFIEIPTLTAERIDDVIIKANGLLEQYRAETADALLSPFKGNTKHGRRRRRLDYATARAILEQACGNEELELPLFAEPPL